MKTKLLLMLLTIALVAGAAQANMLVNSSFEDGAFGVNYSPDFWEHYYTSYPDPVHTWVNNAAEAHSGNKYVRMYNWFVSGTTWSTTAWLGQTVPGVKEDGDYTFSVWAKTGVEDQACYAGIYCEWLRRRSVTDPNWVIIDADSTYVVVNDANWVEVDFGAFSSSEGATAADVWIFASVDNGLRAICYDDVTMLGPDPNVNAGADMISWDGETLSLTGTTSLDDYSTITWSAELGYGAAITNGNTLTPTVDVDCIIPSGPATIANHSFENGLDNWETLTGEGHDTWNGAYPDANGLQVYITPTDGLQCAYVDGVSDGVGTLSQVLANNLVAANTTYTLSVDVVNDGYYEEDVEYRVQLRAGGSILKQDNDGHALDTYGEWKTSSVTYESGDSPTQLGEPLEIRLIAKLGTQEMNFDNVRLTADPNFPAYVPDVLGLKLTLDIDGKYDAMEIDVYPDGCAAWLAAGLRETTDLVGDECITNVADLAEWVKTWPDHNAFTEPKVDEEEQPGEKVILSTDFTNRIVNGNTASNITWYTNGVLDPGDMTTDAPDGLFNYPENTSYSASNDHFAPDRNIGNEGSWSATVTLNLTVPEITLEDVFLDYQHFGNTGRIPIVDKDGTLTVSVTGSVSGLLDSVTINHEVLANDGSGSDTFAFSPPLLLTVSESYDVTILAEKYVSSGANVGLDVLTLNGVAFPLNPFPAHGAYVDPDSELELSWRNMDPNIAGDPVYVDVWFGTEPNDLPPLDPDYDFNKIVDAVEDANSVKADTSTPDTYYWRVNWYIYGSPTGDPIEGPLCKFHTTNDAPVSVKVGGDAITWSGTTGQIQLDASVDDDGEPTLTWSADPATGVVFDPNEFVEDPAVIITKVTDNPSVVTLTLSAQDAVSSDEDTMTIKVYDTACLAAIGEGEEYDRGDFDADCDTDLEDYAAIAEEWLVYNELTTSIVKP